MIVQREDLTFEEHASAEQSVTSVEELIQPAKHSQPVADIFLVSHRSHASTFSSVATICVSKAPVLVLLASMWRLKGCRHSGSAKISGDVSTGRSQRSSKA